MPTPVGPADRDPDDPDLWEEWYSSDEEDDDGGIAPRSLPWPYRLVALVALIGVVALLVLAR